MTEFVTCYTTKDGVHANLHAYTRGDGSLRDCNHALDIVKEFVGGNEDRITQRAPVEGERVMFEVWLPVTGTRHGTSNYGTPDYRQIQPCPQCVAEAGYDIYSQIVRLLRRARIRRDDELAASGKVQAGRHAKKRRGR